MCSSWSLVIQLVAEPGDTAFLLLEVQPDFWNFSALSFISYGYVVFMISSLWLPQNTTLALKKIGGALKGMGFPENSGDEQSPFLESMCSLFVVWIGIMKG